MKTFKSFKLFTAMLLVMAFILIPRTAAWAAKAPTVSKTNTYTVEKYQGWEKGKTVTSGGAFIIVNNAKYTDKITDIKVGVKGLKATSDSYYLDKKGKKHPAVLITGRKKLRNGQKFTVSFKIKSNGKSYKLKTTVVVKGRKPEVKTLKIGSKNMMSYLNQGYRALEVKNLTGKKKVTTSPAKGYRITIITQQRGDRTVKTGKSGTTFDLKKGDVLSVEYEAKDDPWHHDDMIFVFYIK